MASQELLHDRTLFRVDRLAEDLGPDLLITALYVTEDGVAVYPAEAITVRKELVEAGVSVEYEHPAELRQYKRLYSATGQIAVEFAVGLGSSGLIWALQALARNGSERQVKVTATRMVKRRGVKTAEKLVYKGPATGAAAAVEKWRAEGDEVGS